MFVGIATSIRLLGAGVVGAGLVASGVGIAMLAEKGREVVVPEQDQFENAGRRYTLLRFYGNRNLYFEQSHVNESQDDYIEDHIHGKKAGYVSYIVNGGGNNVRISLEKPSVKPQGIYVGRRLNRFLWKNNNQP